MYYDSEYNFYPGYVRSTLKFRQSTEVKVLYLLLRKVRHGIPFPWMSSNIRMTELIKINHYKAPRDKTICVLNTCKIIFGTCTRYGTSRSAHAMSHRFDPTYAARRGRRHLPAAVDLRNQQSQSR